MKSYVPDYEFKTLSSFSETLQTLTNEPNQWTPFAGGTDLMVLYEAGKLKQKKFLNLWPFDELRGIEVSPNQIRIGALTTYDEIREHSILKKEFPMLCEAASLTGAIAIQNRGTIGGNIANASPAADTPPALLAYNTQLEIISTKDTRKIKYDEFHLDYKKMNLQSNEIIKSIILPRTPNMKMIHYFHKVGTRKAQAISKICFAGCAWIDHSTHQLKEIRIGLGSIAPIPFYAKNTSAAFANKKATFLDENEIQAHQTILEKEITPIDDIRSTAEYRLTVCKNLLKDFCEKLKSI